jgi:hypothetical protein
MAMELTARWQRLPRMMEIEQWDGVNEKFIVDRGAKLSSALGLALLWHFLIIDEFSAVRA